MTPESLTKLVSLTRVETYSHRMGLGIIFKAIGFIVEIIFFSTTSSLHFIET